MNILGTLIKYDEIRKADISISSSAIAGSTTSSCANKIFDKDDSESKICFKETDIKDNSNAGLIYIYIIINIYL